MILLSATLACAIATALPVAPQRPPQPAPTDQTVTVTRGSRLSVDNFAGEVVIRSWDRDSVRVQARHSARTRVNIRNTQSGVTLSASSMSGTSSVDYEITAPSWMPVKVNGTYNYISIEGTQSEVSAETVRGDILIKGGSGAVTAKSIEGEVIVEGARGKISVSSVNESIRVTGTSGDIAAETVNGSITLTGITATIVDVGTVNGHITYEGTLATGGRYSLTTHNGNITVTVPESTNATFSIRTYNGTFSSGLTLKGPAASDVRRGRRETYTLGNGSADVEMESFGGTIRLRRAGAAGSREKEPESARQ
jgi:DUF4097 and DUF4098 domain-containing protein YvlB